MAYSYKKYEESDVVKRAQKQLQDNESLKPGAYQSKWQGQMDDTMSKIADRKPFQYDVDRDPLYNQYKDQYVRGGKLAMQDTMGQAAALAGGYGSSYAQSVGQQAYQNYLTGLTDKIPELYQLALSKYQLDGDALKEQYALLSDRENQDYGRHQDAVAAWQTDRNFLANRYDQERSWDYGKYADDRSHDYSVYRDGRDFDYKVQQDDAARAQAQVEYLLSIGVTPSDDLLAASGLSGEYSSNKVAQVRAAQAAAQEAARAAASRGSGREKEEELTLAEQYAQLEEAGVPQKDLDNLLKSAVGSTIAGQQITEGIISRIRHKKYMK